MDISPLMQKAIEELRDYYELIDNEAERAKIMGMTLAQIAAQIRYQLPAAKAA